MPQTRRRGKKLVADILQATFELIKICPYDDLTMDKIAEQAHTSKTVLYRRWKTKSDVVMAALRAQIETGDFTLTQPNTGSLRGDLIGLFDLIMDRLEQFHFQNMFGLIMEHAGGISMADYFQKFSRQNYLTLIVKDCFAQAQARGEHNDLPIPDYLYDLPFLLALDLLFGPKPVTRAAFHQLVDTALMPVYQQFLTPNKNETET
jgi:AcrR family transcriptional regulator